MKINRPILCFLLIRKFHFLLLVGGLIQCIGCGQPRNGGNGAAADTTVAAAEALVVSRGILIPFVDITGQVSGISEAVVISETEGIIRSVTFQLGDTVSRGTVLVTVDRTVAQLAMQQAYQDLRTATMNLNATRRLYADSAASRSELADAQSVYNGAKAAYESARKRYEDTEVKAPIAGEIASRETGIAVGNLLQPSMAIARIVNLAGLRLESAVGPTNVGLIDSGNEALVLVPAVCSDTMTGEVDAVAAGADPATGSFTVVVSWTNACSTRVRSGMAASARIRTSQTDSVIVVPASTILTNGDTSRVITVSGGRAAFSRVTTGSTRGNRTEIIDGLDVGDTILVSRMTRVERGDTVIVHVAGTTGEWQ